ncbi:unnamed protein product [Caenorhabditis brenneri]
MTTPTEFHFWDRLTPEMKMVCVKHMDFFEKLHFRASSNSGKTLVESQRFDVKQISITDINYGIILEVNINGEDKCKVMAEDDNVKETQLIPFLAYLLKCGNIEELFSKETEEFTEEIIDKLDESGPFRIKKLIIPKFNRQREMFLRRCTPEFLKSAEFKAPRDGWDSLEPIISMESLSKVEVLDVSRTSELTAKIAKMWIERNEDIGRKLEMVLRNPRNDFGHFKETFEERIVRNEDNEVRITTDNEHKHILLRVFQPRENLQMFVIPAKMVKGSAAYKQFFEDIVFDL